MTRLLSFIRARPVWLLLFLLAAIGGTAYALRSRKPVVAANSYHTVKRDDFLVSLVEGGTLRAVQELIIRNELEGGTTIVSVRRQTPQGWQVALGGEARIVETVPGWTHNITNIGDDELIVMLWANEIFEPAKPDTVGMKVGEA